MEYKPAVLFLAFTLATLAVIVAGRWLDGRAWRASLTAYRLRFPRDLSAVDVSESLSVVTGTARTRPLVFEVTATSAGIDHYLLVPKRLAAEFVSAVTTSLPGVRVEEARDHLRRAPSIRASCELATSHSLRPLADNRAHEAMAGLLSALYPLGTGEVIRIQWIVRPTDHTRLVGEHPSDVVRDAAHKQTAPLVEATGRIAISACYRDRRRMLLVRVVNALRVVNAPGARLRARWIPSAVVARRIYSRALPVTRWPAVLNTSELAAVTGIPMDEVDVPGLVVGMARQLPPPPTMPRAGLVLAYSNYPGMVGRPLAQRTGDRLMHMVMTGPTGGGKSTALANWALQDVAAGRGVIVIDPKSDLIDDIAARIPDERADDVIVIDASKTAHPIGFNILAAGRNEQSRELTVERVTHVLSQLWASSWGPRTSDVMRACLLTLTNTRARDGSAFTLAEVPELLINRTFRLYVTGQRGVPDAVRDFWVVYEQMSDAERIQVIGPSMNKLRAILTRTALRLMLGQSTGLDLSVLFRERKILLVPLSKGVIGADAAHLLGSMLVSLLWQEILSRAAVPKHQRTPVFAYLDEFQEFIHFSTGDELAEMLAQARGLGVGLVLAHQFLDQLPEQLTSAVLGTVRSQLVFQLQHRDATKLAPSFAPLERGDLAGLDAFEVALRPCVDAATLRPVTGYTVPLGDPVRDPAQLAAVSLARYGVPRALVEEARRARVRAELGDAPIGRVRP